ncbi:Synapse-associated protein 1 [Entophlyctis luteolus]|nr:Synapse-associated protein 1 [Entophlyctis luteolus]
MTSSYWKDFVVLASQAATTVTVGVQSAAAHIEAAAKNAASDLEQQHRLTVEAKRQAGDNEESPSLPQVKVPAAVSSAVGKSIAGLNSLAVKSSRGISQIAVAATPSTAKDSAPDVADARSPSAPSSNSDLSEPVVAPRKDKVVDVLKSTIRSIPAVFQSPTQSNPSSASAAGASSTLPWDVVSGDSRADLRTQILALSQEKRNFTTSPPEGTDFVFDMANQDLPKYDRDFSKTNYYKTQAILKVDSQLEKMRFDLVPKQIKDELFWRNYFYRVTRLQQSCLLENPEAAISASPGSSGIRNDNVATTVDQANLAANYELQDGQDKEQERIRESLSFVLASDAIPDSLDEPGLGEGEYVPSEAFGADWEKELQNELDDV